jgi:hypothetical protein
MEIKMTPASKRKHGQGRKSKSERVRATSKKVHSKSIGQDNSLPPGLHNDHDNLVVHQLLTTSVGELAVDEFVAPQTVPELRDVLRDVYVYAAKVRESNKAPRDQRRSAKSALSLLTQGIEELAKVSPDGWDGLGTLLGASPLDDKKGEREQNELSSACWKIRMDVAPAAVVLQSAIEAEDKKQTNAGERRKRLRTLVDALADLWESGVGTIAPTVDANRRDDGPAVVHGRRGLFLEFAVALFCKVDVFEESEVEAAVTNVHEARLASTKVA